MNVVLELVKQYIFAVREVLSCLWNVVNFHESLVITVMQDENT